METENKEILQATVSYMRRRTGQVILMKVKGHSNIEGNDKANKLAKLGAQLQTAQYDDIAPIPGYHATGMRLNSASQAILYKGILKRSPPPRRGTIINLDRIRWAIKESNGSALMDKNIWRALRDRTITKEARAFLWKATQNAYKIGEYWEKIPNYKTRSKCHVCDTTEDMEHILMYIMLGVRARNNLATHKTAM